MFEKNWGESAIRGKFVAVCCFSWSGVVLCLLGGNSRTAMVAALSPADINYDETLSTLR